MSGRHGSIECWRFVDIPLKAKAYDEVRDCHYDQNDQHTDALTCIVSKLPEEVAILSDKSKPPADRLMALKFVVHFLGDVRQPLHAEDNNDRGSNNVLLTYYKKKTKLHAMWDGGIIEHQFGWKLGPNCSFDHAAVAAEATTLDGMISTCSRRRGHRPDCCPASPRPSWSGTMKRMR